MLSTGDSGGSAGVTILSKTIVLTAGHCVLGGTEAHSNRYGTNSHTSGGTVVDVRRVAVYRKYDDNTRAHDTALLKTVEPMNLGGTAQAADAVRTRFDWKYALGLKPDTDRLLRLMGN
ncbi:trypsin-like serine protease [Streptomyces alboflavus]|uniref:trypsin-like serine protease n=1 Tax=Streptomyces alboflavus TaxID=67267 RepID=UPI0036B62890